MNKIETCKVCTNKLYDRNLGIVCGLTNSKPSFDKFCPEFIQDESVQKVDGKIIKPNEQRAKNAILLIWIVLALEILSLISSYFQYDLLQTASNGGEISTERVTSNDTRELIIAIFYMVAYIISGVTFIQWFRRAYFNLHQKVNHLSQTEGWAAGCWFVPIVNLYRPYQIMKELYIETKNFLIKSEGLINENFTANSLGLWWTLWIINNIIGQFIFRYSKNADTIDKLTISTVADMAGSIIGILLAMITVKIIKDYSKVEHLLND